MAAARRRVLARGDLPQRAGCRDLEPVRTLDDLAAVDQFVQERAGVADGQPGALEVKRGREETRGLM
jgi:hypothetical protein